MSTCSAAIDVHQHLWPPAFIEALRDRPRRSRGPRLTGWTLRLPGEPDYQVRPGDHDPAARGALDAHCRLIGVSLSSPLGIEYLSPEAAAPLLDAWHQGAADLPKCFRPWAAVNLAAPDLPALAGHLDQGFLGLQVPAGAMHGPAAIERLAPVLRVCELKGRPVMVHPGPLAHRPGAADLPAWWAPVVDYTAQLNAAWWAWLVAGRTLLPDLRICFAAGAGLAPLHHERYAVRGGGRTPPVDLLTFVETSTYGPQAVDSLIRVLGIDVIVNGTDRPYAGPGQLRLGDAATYALNVANPTRFLEEESHDRPPSPDRPNQCRSGERRRDHRAPGHHR